MSIARKHEFHGMHLSSEYISWDSMKQRCHNKNSPSYHRYGAVGITVCDRWRDSFKNFIEDMGKRPKGYTLDRIDGTKGYSIDNCRWADWHTQSINTRLQTRNKTGYKGVYFREDTGKYSVKITHYKKVIYIGNAYEDLEEAISARLMAEAVYWS